MRLIDADALKESVHAHDYVLKDCLNSTDKGMFTVGIMQVIAQQPTVDAEPVRHGKWELAEDGWYCSACEMYPPFDCDPEEKGIPYCPNCGARMDEE
jgi:hypothetical protein